MELQLNPETSVIDTAEHIPIPTGVSWSCLGEINSLLSQK